jgi:simple sugar transport system permease protein
MFGRGIYAVGGDEASAQRAGFPVGRIKFFVYCIAGAFAGLTGIAYFSMTQFCSPNNLVGSEMNVIAAVVLGGTSMVGGKGTLLGAMLGVALLTIMQNSLIMIGVSSYWMSVVTGGVIIVGTAITSYRDNPRRVRLGRSKKGSVIA